MVNPKIRKVFEDHVRQVSALGNGNFGLRSAFLAPLRIRTSSQFSGDLIVSNDLFGKQWDCGRTALRVGRALEREGFEVRYKQIKSAESNHDYAEVFDPTIEEWVALDPTPWYEKINPDHKPTCDIALSESSFEQVALNQQQGVLLSAERQPDATFIETYLSGSRESTLENKLATLKRLRRGETVEQPQYRLEMWSRLCSSLADKTIDAVIISVDVLRSEKLWNGSGKAPEKTLDELACNGTIKLNVQLYADGLAELWSEADPGRAYKMPLNNGVAFLDNLLKTKTRYAPLARNLKANLGAMANLLLHLGQSLETLDGCYIVHASGLVSKRSKPEAYSPY